jgi:hypothetical protein
VKKAFFTAVSGTSFFTNEQSSASAQQSGQAQEQVKRVSKYGSTTYFIRNSKQFLR